MSPCFKSSSRSRRARICGRSEMGRVRVSPLIGTHAYTHTTNATWDGGELISLARVCQPNARTKRYLDILSETQRIRAAAQVGDVSDDAYVERHEHEQVCGRGRAFVSQSAGGSVPRRQGRPNSVYPGLRSLGKGSSLSLDPWTSLGARLSQSSFFPTANRGAQKFTRNFWICVLLQLSCCCRTIITLAMIITMSRCNCDVHHYT
jgi:hypothetical protein